MTRRRQKQGWIEDATEPQRRHNTRSRSSGTTTLQENVPSQARWLCLYILVSPSHQRQAAPGRGQGGSRELRHTWKELPSADCRPRPPQWEAKFFPERTCKYLAQLCSKSVCKSRVEFSQSPEAPCSALSYGGSMCREHFHHPLHLADPFPFLRSHP